jgi:hypothetical protein
MSMIFYIFLYGLTGYFVSYCPYKISIFSFWKFRDEYALPYPPHDQSHRFSVMEVIPKLKISLLVARLKG